MRACVCMHRPAPTRFLLHCRAFAEGEPQVTEKVFLDLAVDGKPELSGRVVLGLYGADVPKTVANFVALCEWLGVGTQAGFAGWLLTSSLASVSVWTIHASMHRARSCWQPATAQSAAWHIANRKPGPCD